MAVAPPQDSYHRSIDYLRLSVTDRCNLRCVYCMPEDGVPKLSHDDVLSYEELLRLARVAVSMGIGKVRVTGGEPLVRRGILEFIQRLAQIPDLRSLTLTTNGLLLDRYADDLRRGGVERVNVSLDTLDPEKYATITRCGRFADVWAGVEAAHRAGFHPVKLNVVVMRGVNDDEIEDMARVTLGRPFHVRFIECMPFREEALADWFVGTDEILDRLKAAGLAPEPAESRHNNGPARYFRFPGAPGKIGLISPLTHHFCPACNRLRVTADGRLRTCLFSREDTDLRALLRSGASDREIEAAFREGIARKPERHVPDRELLHKCISRPMSAIGG
jgi:cyclic pyranopterin phosphate synthase